MFHILSCIVNECALVCGPNMDDKKKLAEVGHDLKKALEAWEDLSQQDLGISADQQRLEDLQSLLKKLKDQIEDFR